MYVCMYVMYVCMHACMRACMYVCMYVCIHVCMYHMEAAYRLLAWRKQMLLNLISHTFNTLTTQHFDNTYSRPSAPSTLHTEHLHTQHPTYLTPRILHFWLNLVYALQIPGISLSEYYRRWAVLFFWYDDSSRKTIIHVCVNTWSCSVTCFWKQVRTCVTMFCHVFSSFL